MDPTRVSARVPAAPPLDATPIGGFDPHDRYGLTPSFLIRDRQPFVPVSGELHYSRVRRAHWRERLELMRSGGITAVATYVFWLHHEPERGSVSFEGGLDAAAFVRLCAELDLAVVLRVGPWAHGEARNGGLPDWVQHSGAAVRTNDPAYLALVADWFAALGRELAPLCGPDGNVLAIQIENELYDQPDHIATLREMARAVGLRAPIYTATAWGRAQLPAGAVMPLYGGYADGFWVDADAPWDDTFHEHFFFSHTWDDPGIGADIAAIGADIADRDAAAIARREREWDEGPSRGFPPATCELGGGMATAYHRRPTPLARDIAAVAHTKLGNGSVWQGYYMYAGGTNPADDLQESQATGYPNDLPRFDYDFHAPIGAAGQLAPSHAELRLQHAFLDAFGGWFATLPSILPDRLPDGVHDRRTPRWAVRSDGSSGVLFVTWHEPFDQLEPTPPLVFDLELADGTLSFPDQPVSIPPETVARWPLRLAAGGSVIEWATASLLTRLDGDGSGIPDTIVLLADAGVPARIALPADAVVTRRHDRKDVPVADGVVAASGTDVTALRIDADGGAFDLLVLPSHVAHDVWVLGSGVDRTLLLSHDPLIGSRSTGIRALAPSSPRVARYDPATGGLVAYSTTTDAAAGVRAVPSTLTREAGIVPASYGARERRAAAPTQSDIDRFAARWALDLSADAALPHARLVIEWAGDVAVLLVDGAPVADRFWDGSPWTLRPADLGIRPGSEVTLQIMPLHPDASVHLPVAAAARRDADTALCALHDVALELHAPWNLEEPGDAR